LLNIYTVGDEFCFGCHGPNEEGAMKKFGIISFTIAGFIAGIAFVYSCSGGGSGGSNAIAHPSDPANIISTYDAVNLASISNSVDWLTLGPDENFVVTDIISNFPICLLPAGGERRFCATGGVGPGENTYSLSSGIRFYPNETIRIYFNGTVGQYIYNISGYYF
jgi:hypothetical protein